MLTLRASRSRWLFALVLVVASGVAACSRACGKSEITPPFPDPPQSLAGTPCELLDNAPTVGPRSALPSDPLLASYTEQIEGALEASLALEGLVQATDYGYRKPLTEAENACARRLLAIVTSKLAPEDIMRKAAQESASILLRGDASTPERTKLRETLALAADASLSVPSNVKLERRFDSSRESGYTTSVTEYLASFPANARLRRALVPHFHPIVEDNYSSFDGDLDKNEVLLRETVEAWPARAALDYELLVAADWTSQDPEQRTWMWLRVPFARITLDLGRTGNALRVVRDLAKQRPEIAKELLPVAKKWHARARASNQRARWSALVAYLEADAPDPGDPPEPALARAIAGDERSARWALGYVPNELEEHAPRPFPFVRDRAVIQATVARAEKVTTDEDRILVLDALAQMPPGTSLETIASMTASLNPNVWRAAVEAISRQIDQLPIKAEPGELAAGVERRKHAASLLGPHVSELHADLAPRVCAHPEAIAFLADAGDKEIDDAVVHCIEATPNPDIDFLTTLFHACLDHPRLGWTKTGRALARSAKPGDYAVRVANGCIKGVD